MNDERLLLQPGPIFFDVWRGCMLSRGVTMTEWCRRNGLGVSYLRNIAFGAMSGPKASAVREKMIADAGREAMMALARQRMRHEGLLK